MNKKVLIINGWSDLNAGDSGIVMAMIDNIRKKINNCNITILSELSKENEYYESSIDMIRKYYSDINLIGAPFYKKYNNSIISRCREVISFIKCIILSILPSKLVKIFINNKDYYKSIIEADIILSKGGHFFHTNSSLHGFVHIFKCSYPMIIAKKFNKKYFMIGQSYGPIYRKGLLSKITYNISKNIIESAKGVSVREQKSYDYLKNNHFNMTNINITSDYAFILKSDRELNVPELNNILKKGKFIVITIRQHVFNSLNGESEYLNTINEIAKAIVMKYNYNVVFVPHVQGPNPFENDKCIINKFKDIYGNNKKYFFTTGYYSAKTLKKFYGYATMLIGTRFHSVIFALGENVPSFAISYSGYKSTIIEQFDMKKFMIDINDVNKQNFDKMLELIFELIDKNDEYRKLIKRKFVDVNNLISNDKAFNNINAKI